MTEAVAARRRPGPVRSLTRDRIVATGLEIMARDGLRNVSLRTIAMQLGVDHKTLYTYVSDKDDLLAGMFDAAASALDLAAEDDPRSPEDQLVGLFVSIRRLLIANMDLFHLTRPTSVVGDEVEAGRRMWAAIHALVPDEAGAAELFANLTHLAVGSAMESAQVKQVGASLLDDADREDPGARPHHRPFLSAWVALDREAAFEKLARSVVRLAVAEASA